MPGEISPEEVDQNFSSSRFFLGGDFRTPVPLSVWIGIDIFQVPKAMRMLRIKQKAKEGHVPNLGSIQAITIHHPWIPMRVRDVYPINLCLPELRGLWIFGSLPLLSARKCPQVSWFDLKKETFSDLTKNETFPFNPTISILEARHTARMSRVAIVLTMPTGLLGSWDGISFLLVISLVFLEKKYIN